MSRFSFVQFSFVVALFLLFNISSSGQAASLNVKISKSLSVVNNNGESILYGSILSPKEDEVNILLPKVVLSKIRKSGVNRFSFTLVAEVDSSRTYIIPNELINLRRKIINGRPGIYLVVNLQSLFSLSGVTISPSSLPGDNYRLRIQGVPVFGTKLDETTNSFKYEPPSLIVGNLKAKTSGLITVEDLSGNVISEKTIAASPNGTFLTEVRANKRKRVSVQEERKNLRNQTDESLASKNTSDESDIASTWLDLSGNENNASLYNFSLPSDGNSGWVGSSSKKEIPALRFDGNDDYIELKNYIPTDLMAFTVEMWVKRNGDGIEYPRLFANSTDISLTIVETSDIITSVSNGGLLIRVNGGEKALGGTEKLAPPGTLDGTWQHLAFLWNGSNLDIYVNGLKIGESVPLSGLLNPPIDGYLPVIGGESVEHASNKRKSAFNGDIARVDIYDYALTQEQINQNYSSEAGNFNPDSNLVCKSITSSELPSQKGNILSLNARAINNEGSEQNEITTGLVHAVTDTDLYSVASVENSVESNITKAERPVEIDETSTLTANFVKQNAEIASDIANQQLVGLISSRTNLKDQIISSGNFGCNLAQFADRCNAEDPKLAQDLKDFLLSSACNLPSYLKSIISIFSSDCEILSKGYCEYINRKVDEKKTCIAYNQILSDFKSGRIEKLPCPPENCTEYQEEIKPPDCYVPGEFCEQKEEGAEVISSDLQSDCIHKPVKDLLCARIGADIEASKCSDENYNGEIKPGWQVVKSSKGNEYCVSPLPSSLQSAASINGLLSIEDLANECELRACHKGCKNNNYTNTLLAQSTAGQEGQILSPPGGNCDFLCEADAGKFFDCSDPSSEFFSVKCCRKFTKGFDSVSQLAAQVGVPVPSITPGLQPNNPPLSSPGFTGAVGNKSAQADLRECLCDNPDNFNEKGFAKEGARTECRTKCSRGFEKEPTTGVCLEICDKGQVRDSNGNCRKKCPEGFEETNGSCSCPAGQIIGSKGKCEPITCSKYCRSIPKVKRILEARAKLSAQFFGPTYSATTTTFAPITTPYPGGTIVSGVTTQTNTFGTPPVTALPATGTTPLSPGVTPTETQSPQGTGQIPLECTSCIEVPSSPGIQTEVPTTCPAGQRKDPATNQCTLVICGSDQYPDADGNCRCTFDGSISTGQGCKKSNINIIPTPSLFPTPVPSSTPPLFPSAFPSPSPVGSLSLPICAPLQSALASICRCAGNAVVTGGICTCPVGQNYTISGCITSPTPIPTPTPFPTPRVCGPGEGPTTNPNSPCYCGGRATVSGENSTCQCPGGTPAYCATCCL